MISKNTLSGFSKIVSGLQVPDCSKIILGLQAPDCSKIILGLQAPDCSKIVSGLQVPDYSKMLAALQVPDYSKMLAGLQFPDYSKMLLGLQVPNYRNASIDPSVEGIELLNVPAEDPRQIFPGSNLNVGKLGDLGRLDDEISTVYERSGFEFNNEAYRFLSDLETYLRYLIKKRIIEPHEKNLESKIPREVLSRWEERKSRDASNEYDLIDYSDFTDLKIIFEKGRNKELFNDIFNNEECKALITKLHELDPIRKKIAHFRPLTKIEFTRLVLYHNDIFTIAKSRRP
ncbi:Swt1 family HEPN domain-containing protein [Methanosarcina hadiensis]|uniref:hypothetical protein n=1 Tax=Methanosarcina hadiensis TaxID=3078083 RepID=UPI003977629A